MASLSVSEIVKLLQNAGSKSDRVEILKTNDCSALRGILRMNYDAELKMDLPEGEPPYKKNSRPDGFGETTLKASSRGWYVFSKQCAPNLKQSRREAIFISLLESLSEQEAQIFLQAKDRKLDLGLTKKVIDEAFPGLIKSEIVTHATKEKPKKANSKASSKGNGEGVRNGANL